MSQFVVGGFKVHAGINMGTNGLGIAYLCDGKEIIHSKWKSTKYSNAIKQKTSILLDKNGNMIQFGFDAKDMWMEMGQKQKDWMYFDEFVASAYGSTLSDSPVNIATSIQASNGKSCQTQKIFIETFKYIAKECKQFLRKQKIKTKKHDIAWIISLPSILSTDSQNKMIKWLIEAGLVDKSIENQCKIVNEPDCVSLTINRKLSINDEEKKSADDITGIDDQYVLVNAGGRIVSVSVHQKHETIVPAVCGLWGSTYIDQQFVQELNQLFDKKVIDKLRNNHISIYEAVMESFRKTKHEYDGQNKEKNGCVLPDDFIAFLEKNVAPNLNQFVANTPLAQSNLVKMNGKYLIFENVVWKSMFDHVIYPINKQIEQILTLHLNETKNCKFLCLVGGLACSPYFQRRMKEKFSKLTVYVVPPNPILSVAVGAAYYGNFQPKDKSLYKIIIAVDFGTDGVAIAYGIKSEVFIHDRWRSKRYGCVVKPKTIILLDENNNVVAFGQDALHIYVETGSYITTKWKLFQNFKRKLYKYADNDSKEDDTNMIMTTIADTLTAENGMQFPSELVWIEVWKHIEQETQYWMKRQKIKVSKHEIQWVTTVPAMWDNKARSTMKSWMSKVVLVDEKNSNQCLIVTESESAVLSILNSIYDQDNLLETDEKESSISKGDKYILIDAGGGTVDFACHEILDRYHCKQILPPSGGRWGSTYIDDEYIKLLNQIFNKQWIKEFKFKFPAVYVDMLNDFQTSKQSFYSKPGRSTHNCRLQFEFLVFMEEKIEQLDDDSNADEDIEDYVDNAVVFGEKHAISLDEDLLCIKVHIWQKMFDSVINPIIDHTEHLLKLTPECKYLFLTGGLSSSKYFQSKMRKTFEQNSEYNLRVVSSRRPMLDVVRGSAYFGLYKNVVVSKHEKQKQMHSDFKLKIAVDFGTDGTGVAYAFDGDIHIHGKWLSPKYGHQVKPKTMILLNENGEPLKFGLDAKFIYMSMPKKKDEWMLFERFKMSLFETNIHDDNKQKEKVNISYELKATNKKRWSSELVFIAAFKHIEKEAKAYLKLLPAINMDHITDDQIQWIITVPAIWNDQAKNTMKQCAIKAGLINENIINQCKIVYEPDCASLAIQYEIKENINNEQKNDSIFSTVGDKYILVDAGGGTVDVACHQITGQFGVKEILHPSGGPWGSCYIDDEYVKLLQRIFTKEWIDELETNHPNTFIETMHEFQTAKKTFWNKQTKKSWNCKVPMDFLNFISMKIKVTTTSTKTISDLVHSKTGGDVSYVDGSVHFKIGVNTWISLFEPVIDKIVKHVKKLLNQPLLMRKCKYVFLVGGLSCSAYFQYKMKTEFGPKSRYRLQIIIPKNPILSVVKGAAYFGLKEDYIKGRVLQRTYGHIVSKSESLARESNIPEQFIQKNKYYSDWKQKWFVGNCFQVMAAKNEQILFGDTKHDTTSRGSPTQMSVLSKIYCSDMKNPLTKFDGTEMATMELQWDNKDPNDMNIGTEFNFHDTLITVKAYKQSTPDNIQRVELNYKKSQMK